MRNYIRHPSDIPIELVVGEVMDQSSRLRNISHGGFSYLSTTPLALNSRVTLKIPSLGSDCLISGEVAWCKPCDARWEVGVCFGNASEALRSKMVEQVCQIESYRHTVLQQEGRKLSADEAALEWIAQFAESFSAQFGSFGQSGQQTGQLSVNPSTPLTTMRAIMDARTLLETRNSAPKLQAPAPSAEVRERLFNAAFRAPDHARLRPWRFLTIEGDALNRLGELYADAAKLRDPAVSEADLEKFRKQPLRAPLIVVVIATIQEHPKVPRDEQIISAGCTAHGILLAAHAEGFAGIWRTGTHATDRNVAKGLGLAENEEVVGYLYLGTIQGDYKPLPVLDQDEFVSEWQG